MCFDRHPFILSFLDSMETDEAVVLVSEACVPLESWLKTVSRETDSTNAQEIAVLEGMIVWGLKCLLQALNFLHDNCRLLHGNIGMHAIFVTPSGDWKLSAMEIACNAAQGDDFSIFEKYQHILDKPFASPERSSAFSMSKEVPHFVDIYSLGHCMQRCFDSLNMEISKALVRYSFTLAVLRAYLRHELFFVRVLSQMTAVEWKRRPKADSLVKAPMFRSDHILLLESISELSLRPSAEILDILKGIEPKLSDISKSICSHKVLPSITKTLQIALNDFSNRDSREACRQVLKLIVFFHV